MIQKLKTAAEKCREHSRLITNAILLAAAFISTLVFIINGAYIKHGYNISTNTIADRDFFAPTDLINEIATQRLISEAWSSVPDVYNHDSSVDTAVIGEINAFFDKLDTEDFTDVFAEGTAPAGITENIFITQTQYDYIMSLPVAKRSDFEAKVLAIAKNALDQGVRAENIDTTLASVKDSVNVLQYDGIGTDTAFNIISSALKPNLIVDTEATQKARDDKESEVEPVKVLANQKIVGEGEVITDEIYALLDSSGFLKKEGLKENAAQICGVAILLFVLFVLICSYIYSLHKELYLHLQNSVLIFTMYMLVITITHFMGEIPYMFVPVLAFTMLTAILYGVSVSFFMNIFISLITMLIYKGDLSYLVYFWLCGSVISVSFRLAGERNKILFCGMAGSLVFAIIMISIQMFFNLYWKNYIFTYSLYAFLSGLVSIIICIGSIPLLESAFGIVTDYKLQDLTSSNQKLLHRLMIEAPGTYHHCLITANLAEAAAYSIGANPNIARAGAFYHDIGKLARPMYFAENMHGSNIHDKLLPYDSAKIIMNHVTDGVELAKQHKLPDIITDVIREHHGTTLVKFFYYKQCKLAEENESIEKPDEADFRYKGSLPKTKESAVIMLADTVEAAVRSSISKGMTEPEVADFIKTLIKDKLNDGQLNESGLTINDLDKIGAAFLEIFKGMYHERVAYPKEANKE